MLSVLVVGLPTKVIVLCVLTLGCGYLYLSNNVGFITIPEAKPALAGVKSLIILNSELSKNLISLT